jgi:chromosome segregation ATPase
MTTGSGEALQPVIGQLTELITRLDQQQHAEEEHKAWCEKELSETAQTKAHHEQLVEEFKGKIDETTAIIAEKQQAIADTAQSIEDMDAEFTDVTDLRAKAKADFEAEQQDYRDAITALNQAIDILGDFYRAKKQGAFLQDEQVVVPDGADRSDVPQMQTLSGGYQKKGGARVVEVLKTTRIDFNGGLKHLQLQEEQEVKDYEASKDAYQKARGDLVEAGNRLNAELQGAQLALAQYQTDLADNEDKVQAATSYLAQVGGSCNVLIDNFATRSKLRAEEKQAITDAVNILQQAV